MASKDEVKVVAGRATAKVVKDYLQSTKVIKDGEKPSEEQVKTTMEKIVVLRYYNDLEKAESFCQEMKKVNYMPFIKQEDRLFFVVVLDPCK